jgi:hypothetical protein
MAQAARRKTSSSVLGVGLSRVSARIAPLVREELVGTLKLLAGAYVTTSVGIVAPVGAENSPTLTMIACLNDARVRK